MPVFSGIGQEFAKDAPTVHLDRLVAGFAADPRRSATAADRPVDRRAPRRVDAQEDSGERLNERCSCTSRAVAWSDDGSGFGRRIRIRRRRRRLVRRGTTRRRDTDRGRAATCPAAAPGPTAATTTSRPTSPATATSGAPGAASPGISARHRGRFRPRHGSLARRGHEPRRVGRTRTGAPRPGRRTSGTRVRGRVAEHGADATQRFRPRSRPRVAGVPPRQQRGLGFQVVVDQRAISEAGGDDGCRSPGRRRGRRRSRRPGPAQPGRRRVVTRGTQRILRPTGPVDVCSRGVHGGSVAATAGTPTAATGGGDRPAGRHTAVLAELPDP